MTQRLKQPIAWITALAVMLTAIFIPIPRVAAAGTEAGAFTVIGGTEGKDYSYENNVLTILTNTAITIANTDPDNATTDTIVVSSAKGANITLAGVNINVSRTSDSCAFQIASAATGDVTIALAAGSENVLKSGENCAGLQKDSGAGYNLTINGEGKLTASSRDFAAGIGGGKDSAGENITISGSAVVTATGSYGGAGIGGGSNGAGSDIEISGSAVVTADGGRYGAGIGGGKDSAGSDITISGSAKVTANGGGEGAGIGGGDNAKGSDITIGGSAVVIATGGTVRNNTYEGGAGIGGGDNGKGFDITISGSAVVTAKGGNGGAGIGGGYGAYNSLPTDMNIKIAGGSVKAMGGTAVNENKTAAAADIGTGAYTDVDIKDGIAVNPTNNGTDAVYLFTASNPEGYAVYVGGTSVSPANHKRADSSDTNLYIYLTGAEHTIKIGDTEKAYKFSGTTNTFYAQDLTVTANDGGVLSDSDYTFDGVLTIKSDRAMTISGETTINAIVIDSASGADITLDGVNIDMSAVSGSAAMQITDNCAGDVTVTLAAGSENVLKSGANCAGLQKDNGAGYNLTINGEGKLTANGGANGAGIGGGSQKAGSNITISGSAKVTATGVEGGAGIGGGSDTSSDDISNIKILGGSVKATGAYAIGSSAAAVIPTNGTEYVYLLKLLNPKGETVLIGDADGNNMVEYTPANHYAADSSDAYLYAWVTGANHTVQIGTAAARTYTFNSETSAFSADEARELTIEATSGAIAEDTDYTYTNGVLTIKTNTSVTVSGGTLRDTIVIDSADGATITLDGLYIDVSKTDRACAFKISENCGDVKIILADGTENILKSGKYCAALQKNSSAESKLEISGSGSLIAEGGNFAAGIGGGYNGAGSNIAINISGTAKLTATGGDSGAGIGGGSGGDGKTISVSGMYITATGGEYAAGIGGGYGGNGSDITISKGIRITATGGEYAAGIGGGYCGNGSDITISKGIRITATGGEFAAGIGGGYGGNGSDITISNSSYITATGGDCGAGIGGGHAEPKENDTYSYEGEYSSLTGFTVTYVNGNGSDITISNSSNITATGGEYAAGIGGGYGGNGSAIEICDEAKVSATGGGAGIGGGSAADGYSYDFTTDTVSYFFVGGKGSDITISGKSCVTAKGSAGAAAIGGGHGGAAADVTIAHSSVKTEAGVYNDGKPFVAADIGSGVSCTYENYTWSYSDGTPLTPVNSNGVPVYPATIDNPTYGTITVGGEDYSCWHDTPTLSVAQAYLYLPGEDQTVMLGNTPSYYKFIEAEGRFAIAQGTDFTITGEGLVYGKDYTYPSATGVLTILSDKAITISGTTTNHCIVVEKDVSANITLDGVNIDLSEKNSPAFKIEDDSKGDVTVTLADGSVNTLKGGSSCAGLQKNRSDLFDAATVGKLTINGSGSLIAEGGRYGAGIGGGNGSNGSNITVSGSAVVSATGGYSGAGIGGGQLKAGSNITISGSAKVTATGDGGGAGIGGGTSSAGYDITINGSAVVTAKGGNMGAGIGGGNNGAGYDITISGSAVVSATGNSGAGIGGGNSGAGYNITIKDNAEITANGGSSGAGIGGGASGAGYDITISGSAVVTAKGGNMGAGIGGGNRAAGYNITIGGGAVVTAAGGNLGGNPGDNPGGAGIGGGASGAGYNITIGGSATVTAAGACSAVGIGGYDSSHDIKITGGSVKAVAGYNPLPQYGGTIKEISTTPTNGSGEVYLLKLLNPKGETVLIGDADGNNMVEYTPANHYAADSADGFLYAWVTGENHNVKIGDAEAVTYTFDSANGTFSTAAAANALTIKATDGSSTIAAGTDYIYVDGVLAIMTETPVTISGATITDTIVVDSANGATITLDGLYIDVSETDSACAFNIDSSCGDVTIKLADGTKSVLKSGSSCAGLEKRNSESQKLEINGDGELVAVGGANGAGIGGGDGGAGSNITISGGTVTATGGAKGAGIGGGNNGTAENINITGGSVKAIAGNGNAAIGTTPTDGTNPVYLREIDTTGAASVTINGNAFQPVKHGAESKIYVYLPAKTAADPNVITVGEKATKLFYDTENAKWLTLVDIPTADGTVFTYNGSKQTYTLTASEYYTISGNKETNAGDYTVKVTLKDLTNTVWSDGTAEAKEYTFTINPMPITAPTADTTVFTYNGSEQTYTLTASEYYTISGNKKTNAGDYTVKVTLKDLTNTVWSDGSADAKDYPFTIEQAKPTLTVTATPTAAIAGTTITVTATSAHPTNAQLSDIPAISLSYQIGSGKKTAITSGSFVIPKGTANGTKITIYAATAESTNYEAAEKTATVVVTACTHPNKDSEWKKDGTYHWHICLDCDAEVDKAEHISSGAATPSKAETCTECGYEISPVTGFVAAPLITPDGGEFTGSQTVTITCATEGATIYYTLDGTTPTAASTKYTGTFTISATTTIKAIAVKDSMGDSKVITAEFTKQSSGGGSGSGSGSGSGGGSTGGHSGGNSSNYPTNTTPTINGTNKTWSAIATELENAAANSEATISLNGNYEVPVEVIKAIADKNLKVTFVIDSWRSWYLDGADIEKPAAADFSAIQLPSSVIDGSSLRGTAGARLRIDGTNNPATLKVSFNKKYAGQFANLYRKDGDKLVFVDTVKIDENGSAQLEITDGGDYIFMLCEYSDRPGDMNNDGKLTAADASTMLKYIVRLIDDGNVQMADLNGDGKINARDAVIALKKVVGLE